MFESLRKLWTDEDGLVTVEYALLLSLLVVGTVAAWSQLAASVRQAIENAAADVSNGS